MYIKSGTQILIIHSHKHPKVSAHKLACLGWVKDGYYGMAIFFQEATQT